MKKKRYRVIMLLCCFIFSLTASFTLGSLNAEAATRCVWCNGKGEVLCRHCGGNMGYRCYLCHGSRYSTCQYCYGRGYLGADLSGSSSGSSSGSASTSIKLSSTKLTLVAGRTAKLKVSGTKKKVSWSTSKKSVATVSKAGKVTAKKAGSATITAKVGNKKLKCKVTVKKKVVAKGIKFKETSKFMLVGEKAQIKPTITPAGVTEKYKISWSSSNKNVVSVDQNGNVTAKGPGTAVITAKLNKKKASCKIRVATSVERLRDFLVTRGTQTSGGVYSAGYKGFLGDQLTVSYDTVNRSYKLLHVEDTAKIMITFNETFSGNAPVYYYWHGSYTDTEVEGTTEINIPSYNSSTKLMVHYTPGKSTNRRLVETGIPVALYTFEDFLKDAVGVNLKSIGFRSF